jgi:hypothetical protein
VLEDGGTFVAKVLAGGAENELQATLKKNFRKVANVKPPGQPVRQFREVRGGARASAARNRRRCRSRRRMTDAKSRAVTARLHIKLS